MCSRFTLSSGLCLLVAGLLAAQPPRPPAGDDKAKEAADRTRVDALGDPLPQGATLRLGTSRLRSDNSVSQVAFAPGGKEVVTGSYSNRLQFWDVATGKMTRTWTVGTYSVYGLAFDKAGKTLAVAGGDGTIRLLDAKTGAEKRSLQDPNNRYGTVSVVLSPDGKTALMLHRYNRQLVVFDAEKGTVKHRYQNVSTYSPAAFEFTPDSKSFVGLWTDNRLNLIDVDSGKARNLELNQAAGNVQSSYSSRIASMAITPDGKQMIYRPTNDRQFTVIELATGKPVKKIDRGSSTYAYNNGSMTVTPNSRFFMEAGGDTAIRVWGLASGKVLRSLTAPTSMQQHAMSPDGKMVASSSGNCIFLWDLSTGKQLHQGHGHSTQVYRVAFSADGRFLASAGSSTLRLWDLASGKEVHNTRLSGSYSMSHFTLSDDGKAARWVGYDRAVYQWRPGADREPVKLTSPRNLTVSFSTQAITPDGKWMAAINYNDRKVRLIDLIGTTADKELMTLPQAYSNNLNFSPDGKRLVVGASDRSITLFDVKTGDQLKKIGGETNPNGYYYGSPQVHFSNDGRNLLTFDNNGEGKLLEVLTGSARLVLERGVQSNTPTAITWSRDNRLVARSSYDGTVSVLDALTGREIVRYQAGQGSVAGLAFSHDGRKLATGGANTTVLVWDVPAPGRPTISGSLDERAAWRDLEDADATKAYRAMVYLHGAPATALKLFKGNLKPRQAPNLSRVDQLIKDLDDDKYMTREKASDELAELGILAEAALKKASKSDSLEVRRRAQDLLRRMKGGTGVAPERLRAYRAVEVMEMIGTPAARDVLKEVLKSKIDPPLEAAVRDALARMGEPQDPTKPGAQAKP